MAQRFQVTPRIYSISNMYVQTIKQCRNISSIHCWINHLLTICLQQIFWWNNCTCLVQPCMINVLCTYKGSHIQILQNWWCIILFLETLLILSKSRIYTRHRGQEYMHHHVPNLTNSVMITDSYYIFVHKWKSYRKIKWIKKETIITSSINIFKTALHVYQNSCLVSAILP